MLLTLLVSCNKHNSVNERFYQAFGVVKESEGKLYIETDKSQTINPSVASILSIADKDKRVWTLYTTENNSLDAIKADIFELLRVTEFNIQNDGLDTLKADPVSLKDIWIAHDYLTLIMEISAKTENSLALHKYSMYSDMVVSNDTLNLEFRYDSNNDEQLRKYEKVIALKLSKDLNPNSESTVLAIRYNPGRGTQKTIYMTYKPE